MNKLKKIVFCTFVAFLFTSCIWFNDDPLISITVKNKTASEISVSTGKVFGDVTIPALSTRTVLVVEGSVIEASVGGKRYSRVFYNSGECWQLF